MPAPPSQHVVRVKSQAQAHEELAKIIAQAKAEGLDLESAILFPASGGVAAPLAGETSRIELTIHLMAIMEQLNSELKSIGMSAEIREGFDSFFINLKKHLEKEMVLNSELTSKVREQEAKATLVETKLAELSAQNTANEIRTTKLKEELATANARVLELEEENESLKAGLLNQSLDNKLSSLELGNRCLKEHVRVLEGRLASRLNPSAAEFRPALPMASSQVSAAPAPGPAP
ncbi:MAG: hypothetical protein K0S29_729 [Gammaproteobacteria bacterium]|nr:hypothetical protein [Gammaproteobacteria bacterium]